MIYNFFSLYESNSSLIKDMTGTGDEHAILFFIPVFFFHIIFEFVPLYSNADLPVSVICDADLI